MLGRNFLLREWWGTGTGWREDALSLGLFQGQAGCGYEQTGQVEGAPDHGRGIGTRCFLGSHPR